MPEADLAALAASDWWRGGVPESLAVTEELFGRLLAGGQERTAALRATELALQWSTRGDLLVASGWLNRARRLLAALPEGPEHGYLLYLEAVADGDMEADPAAARTAAARLHDWASRFGDPALGCIAHVVTGLAELRAGQAGAGFNELDEAMLPVLAGSVPPLFAGDIYCTVIHTCHLINDLARMRAWTQALAGWSAIHPPQFMYASVTRVHQLQLTGAEGGWDAVEADIGASSESLADAHSWMAGAGFYELGEVHRLRGRHRQALAAFGRARELGVDP
ncbi:hypothetical protein ACQCSX_03450 [Pseudarthrobacter sp. P1]|uniref:hypothetical protein n=1 Tax=Pseudarthrobacter sp. P1 TaxID=3418418 RepID=UPI003CF27B9A